MNDTEATHAAPEHINVRKLTRQLNGIMAHLQEHPNDTLSQQRVATIKNLLSR